MPNKLTSLPIPALLLCEGKDCFKKQRPAYEAIRSSAEAKGLYLAPVNCQGSCKGPTAVVPTDSGPRWFEALDCGKSQQDLIAFARGAAAPSKRLIKRELTGKRRARAAKKLAKQLG